MKIDYNHSSNLHTCAGAKAAFSRLFGSECPRSILDVGCGTGTWLRAATESGAIHVSGIDGVSIPPEKLLFDPDCFRQHDLTTPIDLGRRFDVVICLEVAEHLNAEAAPVLVETLTKHADWVVFSAACPGQSGEHHVNCQWPGYWQELFNRREFVCEDALRWKIWSVREIEPWYRQNIFSARRNPRVAGKEARIVSVIHPDMPQIQALAAGASLRSEKVRRIEQGGMPMTWYVRALATSLLCKLRRRI